MNKCPKCESPVRDGSKFCGSCGAALDLPDYADNATPPTTPKQEPSETILSPPVHQNARPIPALGRKGRCKFCGKLVPAGSNPCPHCGHELKWVAHPASQANADAASPTPIVSAKRSSIAVSANTAKSKAESLELRFGDPKGQIRRIVLFLFPALLCVSFLLWYGGISRAADALDVSDLVWSLRLFGLCGFLACFSFTLLLAGFSFDSFYASRWRCRTARNAHDPSSLPSNLGKRLMCGVEVWAEMWIAISFAGGLFAVLSIIIDIDGQRIPFWMHAGSAPGLVLSILWVLCLKGQVVEVEETKVLLRKRARGDETEWKKRQLQLIVDDMVAIPNQSFALGKYPVTQAQWDAVMDYSPSEFDGDDLPVENVSWENCQAFLQTLNATEIARASGMVFRLPTEEEWEFACRAGTKGDYCRLSNGTEITEDTLGEVAWFSCEKSHPVGQKEPNAFGLYDMHGNVWEWTQTAVGENRVLRGGSYSDPAGYCESSGWRRGSPSDRSGGLGFRLCADQRTC